MLNRYSYVRNNPLNFVDPSGYKKKHRSFFRAVFAAIAAVVATVLTGGNPEAGAQVFVAVMSIGGAAVGDQVGASLDRRANASASAPSSDATSPRGPPASPVGGPVGAVSAPFQPLSDFFVPSVAADDGSVPDRELLAKRYRQDLELIRALSLKANDRINITVGSRGIGGIPAHHKYIRFNGSVWEMGPREGRITTSNTTDVVTWRTGKSTQNALNAGAVREVTVSVSASGLVTSMGLYEAYWGKQTYSPASLDNSSFNSNFAVNSVIYGAGGPRKVKGLGWTPGFPDD